MKSSERSKWKKWLHVFIYITSAIAISVLLYTTFRTPPSPSVSMQMHWALKDLKSHFVGCVSAASATGLCQYEAVVRERGSAILGPLGDFQGALSPMKSPMKVSRLLECKNGGIGLEFWVAGPNGGEYESYTLDSMPVLTGNCSGESFEKGDFVASGQFEFRDAILTGSVFRQTDLSVFMVNGSQLQDARFEHADLHKSKIKESALSGSHFNNVNLMGAHFEDSNLEQTVFTQSKLNRVEFDETDLSKASFFDCDLSDASFIFASDSKRQKILNSIQWESTICPDGTPSSEHKKPDGSESCLPHLLNP